MKKIIYTSITEWPMDKLLDMIEMYKHGLQYPMTTLPQYQQDARKEYYQEHLLECYSELRRRKLIKISIGL